MSKNLLLLAALAVAGFAWARPEAQETASSTPPRAFVDGRDPGWRAMEEQEFTSVNCAPDTFRWENGVIHCSGTPVGVVRTKQELRNFELSVQWRHLQKAGNSGIFVWAIPASIQALERGEGRLPSGIEVQVLDLGYKEAYEQGGKRKADWFTCHGDVFPVGAADMQPFPPVAPDKKRSFPTKELSRGVGEWNHYYIRAIDGEVRLWVNGEEVSGGTACKPAEGYLCLESEGAPVEFRDLRIRVLP
jgi:hypothetical protein